MSFGVGWGNQIPLFSAFIGVHQRPTNNSIGQEVAAEKHFPSEVGRSVPVFPPTRRSFVCAGVAVVSERKKIVLNVLPVCVARKNVRFY
jgi:hypothetical protein